MAEEPEPSRRELILDKTIERLEAISTNDGFATDAGKSVWLGEAPPFGDEEDDPRSAIVVLVEDDEVTSQVGAIFVDVPLTIQAVVAVSTPLEYRKAYRDAERMLADIKRAMELTGRTMAGVNGFLRRGVTRTLPREPGSAFVGVSIEYRCSVKESWGNP